MIMHRSDIPHSLSLFAANNNCCSHSAGFFLKLLLQRKFVGHCHSGAKSNGAKNLKIEVLFGGVVKDNDFFLFRLANMPRTMACKQAALHWIF